MLIAREGEEIVCPKGTVCGRLTRDANDQILMAILLRVNLPLRTPTSVMSVPAAAGLWQCTSRFAGECISAGGGCDDAATRPDAFCDQGFSNSDFGVQPRTARDFVRRVFRHLHRNVPVPGRVAVDHTANVGARRRVSRSHFHYPT